MWSGKPYVPAGLTLQHRSLCQISQDNLNQLRFWHALSCANEKYEHLCWGSYSLPKLVELGVNEW